ncbi:hypothetical protein [Plantibacter sp. RU18]|uniref:hypothetical protein n=1 Tax=Plantibacter sp. RU18 TaxID=3158143 RepID=UPI003D3697B0
MNVRSRRKNDQRTTWAPDLCVLAHGHIFIGDQVRPPGTLPDRLDVRAERLSDRLVMIDGALTEAEHYLVESDDGHQATVLLVTTLPETIVTIACKLGSEPPSLRVVIE